MGMVFLAHPWLTANRMLQFNRYIQLMRELTKSGPSSARTRNATEMAFRWRADDGPTLNVSLVAF